MCFRKAGSFLIFWVFYAGLGPVVGPMKPKHANRFSTTGADDGYQPNPTTGADDGYQSEGANQRAKKLSDS